MSRETQQGMVKYLDARMGGHVGAGPNVQWFCPFCKARRGDESDKRKFRLNVHTGEGMCFRCDYRCRTFARLLRDLNAGRLGQAEEELLAGGGSYASAASLRDAVLVNLFASDAPSGTKSELAPVPLPAEFVPLWRLPVPPLARRGYTYLVNDRGLQPAAVARYKLGYCPTGRYAGRVIFPVRQNGECVYFTNRAAFATDLKTLNPENRPGFYGKSDCLFNFDRCAGKPQVSVGEGVLDVIAMEPGVGLLGKVASARQLDLLEELARRGTEEFTLGLDPDASREEYQTYQDMRDRFPRTTYLPLMDYGLGDPHDSRGVMKALKLSRRGMTLVDRVRGVLRGA